MNDKLNPLWDEFILWLALPEIKRGAIVTEEEWAQAHGYQSSRQLRRWKVDPAFLARQQEIMEGLGSNVDSAHTASGILEGVGDVSVDEADYRVVKSQLFNAAKSGNLKAMEQYMKLYGKTWIEEEAAARSSDFTGVDLEKLVAEGLVVVAESVVADALRARGWVVVEPAGPAPEEDGDDGASRV